MISYLEDIVGNKQSEKGTFDRNDPKAVMEVLEQSDIFREFSYPLKWNTAILLRAISHCTKE